MAINKNWPLWYSGYRFWRAPIKATSYWFGNLKAFFRRGRYGFSYMDVWDTDSYLSKVIPSMLRHLAQYHCGVPGYIYEKYPEDDETASKIWAQDLNRIADLIEFSKADQDDYNKYSHLFWNEDMSTNKEWAESYFQENACIYKRQQDAIKEAMTWLGEHWFELWD